MEQPPASAAIEGCLVGEALPFSDANFAARQSYRCAAVWVDILNRPLINVLCADAVDVECRRAAVRASAPLCASTVPATRASAATTVKAREFFIMAADGVRDD